MSGAASPRRASAQPSRQRAIGPALRGLTSHWNEPMPWTFVLVVVLLAILGFHNRIARELGTAAPVQGTVTTLSSADNPPVNLVAGDNPAAAQVAAPLPTHAPRDPFQALVSTAGNRVPVAPLQFGNAGTGAKSRGAGSAGHKSTSGTTGQHGTAGGHQGAAGGATTASCPDVHIVRAGESLWSIAQQHVNKTGHGGSAASYWHRIYAANQQAIGANPSQLSIGLHLCLPPGNGPP
jgi:nucleoid-associated protein YgaU